MIEYDTNDEYNEEINNESNVIWGNIVDSL